MIDSEKLREVIMEKLSTIIDPETGVDIVRMRLIEDLDVNEEGYVSYKFHPSSPLCPIAVPLSLLIQGTIAKVPGVTRQEMEIIGYIQAEKLTALLRQMWEDMD